MKLSQIVNRDFQDAIRSLAAEKLPAQTSYKITKIIKKCNEELTTYQEVLKKIQADTLKEDGKVDEESFRLLYADLLETEFELDTIKFADISSASLSARDLIMLESVVVD